MQLRRSSLEAVIMPTLNQHLSQAESNERFAESIAALPARFPDWEITALFYSALHYVDAFLSTQGIHPRNHDSRIESMKLYIRSWEDYRHLYRLSLAARYNMASFTPAVADTVKAGPFRRVKEAILALLPS